jgi:adenylate cyclase
VERRAPGLQEAPLKIGIGLNYGPVVVGDVGSAHSMSFTVIGDTVNTASRLQALTRDLATPLVIGDRLVRAVTATWRYPLGCPGNIGG